MHKQTFDALERNGFAGTVCTLWDENMSHCGQCGVIVNLSQPRLVKIKFSDGETAWADHRKIALGDNSKAEKA